MVSADDLCFYLCDPATGTVIEDDHVLQGRSVAGKVVIFPSGKGSSVVQTDGLYQSARYGNAPRAVIVERPDTVLVASCIILDIPLVDRVEPGFYDLIADGMRVVVNADAGQISVSEGSPG